MGKLSKRQQRAQDKLDQLSDTNTLGLQPELVEDDAPKKSAFAALTSDQQVRDDEESDEEDEEVVVEEQSKSKPKSKKKKKKKKKVGEELENQVEAQTSVSATKKSITKKPGQEMDDIDRALRDIEASGSGTSTPLGTNVNTCSKRSALCSLLAIDLKMLDSDAELRRMFGNKVVASSPRGSITSHSSGYHARLSNNPHHAVNLRHKNSSFAKPTAYWPPYGSSRDALLSMKLLNPTPDYVSWTREPFYTFEHSTSFRLIQQNFIQIIQTMDPNPLYQLLQTAPFHPDTLLQLSDVAAQQGDVGQSIDFLDRALYTFERSFSSLPTFSLVKGEFRLYFNQVENRSLFRAVEKKVESLAKRGCWRSSFEFCKVLLGFDPYTDPYGSLLWLDFLAPKARQYEWLLEALEVLPSVQDENEGIYIDAYPGLAFAKALCFYHLALEKTNDMEKANEALKVAIYKFPMVLAPLSDHTGFNLPATFLKLERSIPQLEFSKRHDYILHLQSQLYVLRSGDLWKEESIKKWIELISTQCVEELEKGRRSLNESLEFGQDMSEGIGLYGEGVAPMSILRHVIVSDIPKMKAFLPPKVRTMTMFSFDPLPPPEGSSYDSDYFAIASSSTQRERPSRQGLRNEIGNVPVDELIEQIQVMLQTETEGQDEDGGMGREERDAMLQRLQLLLRMRDGADDGPPGGFPDDNDEEEQEGGGGQGWIRRMFGAAQ